MGILVAIVVFLVSLFLSGFLFRLVNENGFFPAELFGFSAVDIASVLGLLFAFGLAYLSGKLVSRKELPKPIDEGYVGPILRYCFAISLPLAILTLLLMVGGFVETLIGEQFTQFAAFVFIGLFYFWLVTLGIVANRMGRRWIVWCFIAMLLLGFGALYAYAFFLSRITKGRTTKVS